MATKLIDLRGIRERFPRSKAWIFKEVAAGRFPKPLPLQTSKNLWSEDEVDKYLVDFVAKARAVGESAAAQNLRSRAAKARKVRAAKLAATPTQSLLSP